MTIPIAAGCGVPQAAVPSGITAPVVQEPHESVAVRIEFRYNVDGLRADSPRRESVPLGSDVELQVSGSPAGQVHLRGYELYADVPEGAAAVIRFSADMAGTFPLEFDRRGVDLALIEVLAPAPTD